VVVGPDRQEADDDDAKRCADHESEREDEHFGLPFRASGARSVLS
jgi:hypothetical protein